MNLRGRYKGGYSWVTANRWWSRADRKAARTAAAVLEYEAKHDPNALSRAIRNAVLTGSFEEDSPLHRPKAR